MGLSADLVLTGGPVFVGLGRPAAEWIAFRDGRVLAHSGTAGLDDVTGPGTRTVELGGRGVVPGFNDCHLHLLGYGLALMQINLRPEEVTTLDELLGRVARRAGEAGPGKWVVGGRYNHFSLDAGRHPTRDELDAAAPDNPVYVKRLCGHVGVANSLALKLAGVDEATADPQGGELERRDGRLTGLLKETAQDLVLRAVPPAPLGELVAAIEAGGASLNRLGVTSVMDAGVGMIQGAEDMAAFQGARRERRQRVRTYLAILAGPDGILDEAHRMGLITGAGDEHLKCGPAKFFTDGSAGGRTAAMSEPYLGGDGGRGLFIYPDEDIARLVDDAMGRGYQVALHAIGDAAIEQTINALEAAMQRHNAYDRRHRIEHCGFLTLGQRRRMRELRLEPVPQPCFIREFGDLYVEACGLERSQASYPLATWHGEGFRPGASTDTPVCLPDTMANLHAMLTRQTLSGRTLGADERVGIDVALHAMTANGAYLSHSEAVKGTLDPGMLADAVVIDRDLLACTPDEALAAQVAMTILDGEVVYEA